MQSLVNIFWLGTKEFRSLQRDMVMVVFVIYAFTLAIYTQARGTSSEVNNASIAFVDEDQSQLSMEIVNAFYPPRFKTPQKIAARDVDTLMDKSEYMFVVVLPPRFEAYLRAGRKTEIQVNIDATAMQQASIGASFSKAGRRPCRTATFKPLSAPSASSGANFSTDVMGTLEFSSSTRSPISIATARSSGVNSPRASEPLSEILGATT